MSPLDEEKFLQNIFSTTSISELSSKITFEFPELSSEIPSQKVLLISKMFSKLNKDSSNNFFLLQKDPRGMKNSFFFLQKKLGTLQFVGSDKDAFLLLLRNHIDGLHKSFQPKTHREFALVHQTHSNHENNCGDTGIMLLRPMESMDVSALIFNTTFPIPKAKRPRCLIVENFKIFTLQSIKPFLSNFDFPYNDHINEFEFDVIYGEGNKISNKFFDNSFFNSYDEIYYFGDYDDEGYKIYLSFSKFLTNTKFVVPKKEITEYIQSEMNRNDVIQYRAVKDKTDVYIANKELQNLLGLNNTKYQMQQEAFLIQ